MSRVFLLVLVVGLALGVSSAGALRLPGAPRCPVFPKSNPWNQRVDSRPVAANSAQIVDSIGAGTGLHADFGSGLWEGAPIGIPITVVGRTSAQEPRLVRVRRRVRSRPVPHSPQRQDRGRPLLHRRPARADRRPLVLPPLRALRALSEGARLARRVGRDLEHALEQAPAGGLDFGRRGRPADPPGPRALRRGQARGDRPCAALHRRSGRAGPTSSRRATSRATRTTRTCRRWVFACG